MTFGSCTVPYVCFIGGTWPRFLNNSALRTLSFFEWLACHYLPHHLGDCVVQVKCLHWLESEARLALWPCPQSPLMVQSAERVAMRCAC